MNPEIHVFGYPSGCPSCDSLKSLLEAKGVSYYFHHLQRTCATREALRGLGYETVPQVFDLEGNWLGDFAVIRKKFREHEQKGETHEPC